jgi:hypothetical protein
MFITVKNILAFFGLLGIIVGILTLFFYLAFKEIRESEKD